MRNLLNTNKIIDITYETYRQYFKSFMGYSVLMTFLSFIMMYGVIFVVSIFFALLMTLSVAAMGVLDSDGMGFIIIYIIFIPLFLPAISIFQITGAGPVLAADYIRKDRKVTFSEMFTFSFKKIMYVITSTCAFYLIVYGIMLIFGLPYILLYYFGLSEEAIWLQILIGCFFGVFALVALIWISIKGVFYLQVALCEKKHFFKAIKGSFKLVKGRFKNILAIVFTSGLAYLIIYLSLGGLLSAIGNLLPSIITSMQDTKFYVILILLQILMFLIQMFARVILLPVQELTISIAYFNERNRKYGEDIHIRLNKLIEDEKRKEITI